MKRKGEDFDDKKYRRELVGRDGGFSKWEFKVLKAYLEGRAKKEGVREEKGYGLESRMGGKVVFLEEENLESWFEREAG